MPTDCLLLGAAYKCTYLLTNLLDSALTVTHTPSCKQTETRQQATNRFYNKVNKRAIFCAFASRVSSFIVSCLSCFSLCLLTTLSVKGYCTSLHIRTKKHSKRCTTYWWTSAEKCSPTFCSSRATGECGALFCGNQKQFISSHASPRMAGLVTCYTRL